MHLATAQPVQDDPKEHETLEVYEIIGGRGTPLFYVSRQRDNLALVLGTDDEVDTALGPEAAIECRNVVILWPCSCVCRRCTS